LRNEAGTLLKTKSKFSTDCNEAGMSKKTNEIREKAGILLKMQCLNRDSTAFRLGGSLPRHGNLRHRVCGRRGAPCAASVVAPTL